MDNEIPIKIRIADREYPMRVKGDEERALRLAGKLIDKKLKDYQSRFNITDKQDLLAMVAFDALVETINKEKILDGFDQTVVERIDSLGRIISNVK